jgi:hypothetical protein
VTQADDEPKTHEIATHNKPSVPIVVTPFGKELDEFRDPTAKGGARAFPTELVEFGLSVAVRQQPVTHDCAGGLRWRQQVVKRSARRCAIRVSS